MGLAQEEMQIFYCQDTDSHKQPEGITTNLLLGELYFFIQVGFGRKVFSKHFLCLLKFAWFSHIYAVLIGMEEVMKSLSLFPLQPG